jgi:hypothetical protein
MPKSKQRKGHKQKVQVRNTQMKAQATAMQKLFNESMKAQIEELKKQYEAESGKTETTA